MWTGDDILLVLDAAERHAAPVADFIGGPIVALLIGVLVARSSPW
jgi:H+/gluconate symporter-like permease